MSQALSLGTIFRSPLERCTFNIRSSDIRHSGTGPLINLKKKNFTLTHSMPRSLHHLIEHFLMILLFDFYVKQHLWDPSPALCLCSVYHRVKDRVCHLFLRIADLIAQKHFALLKQELWDHVSGALLAIIVSSEWWIYAGLSQNLRDQL